MKPRPCIYAPRRAAKARKSLKIAASSESRDSFGVAISSDPPVDVVLEFEEGVVGRLKENEWHPLQKLQDLPGGRARLTMPLSTTIEIRPWILGWGPYVKVVSPPELAEKIADTARQMASRYP